METVKEDRGRIDPPPGLLQVAMTGLGTFPAWHIAERMAPAKPNLLADIVERPCDPWVAERQPAGFKPIQKISRHSKGGSP